MNTTALPTPQAIRPIDHTPSVVAEARLERLAGGPVLTTSEVASSSPAFRVRTLGVPGAAAVDGEIVLLVTVAEDVPTDDGHVAMPVMHHDGEMSVADIIEIDLAAADVVRRPDGMLVADGVAHRPTMTHLRVARSRDGVNFTVEDQPFLVADRDGEQYGVEDARITKLADRWIVTYTAVSDAGCATGLIETFDFDDTYRLGLIFHPSNGGVSIFPDNSGGLYRALHRPVDPMGAHSLWYAESPDLLHWGNHHRVMCPADAVGAADLGGGPPAILTDAGWLQLFRSTDDHGVPTIEAALLHRWDPTQVLARSSAPLLIGSAGADLEVGGMVEVDGTLFVYFGENGEAHAATVDLDALVDSLV